MVVLYIMYNDFMQFHVYYVLFYFTFLYLYLQPAVN